MKTHVVKTTPEASLAEAVDLMDIYQVNSMPVVDSGGRLCGIIAECDVVRALFPSGHDIGGVLRREGGMHVTTIASKSGEISVADVMQQSVVSISEGGDLQQAARMLIVNDFTRLPVMSSDGQVVGTLNRIDILQAVFEGAPAGLGE